MRTFLFVFLGCLISHSGFCQPEITTGYAVNRNLADGVPLHIAYDFKIKNKIFTKTQIGFKHLNHFNDFVGAKLKVYIWEIHQTASYEVIKRKKFIFKPNVGFNYRFYKWKGEMAAPLNTLPIRAWTIGVRGGNYILVSRDSESKKTYTVNNFGFSFQLQNQFRLSDKVWLHVTPFIEPDYDKSQNTGGCYIGVILKQL